MILYLRFDFFNYSRKSLFIFSTIVLANTSLHATNYYVNDNSTQGDMYTSAIGNDSNDGKSPNSPKLSLLEAYNIASAGDVIYVDTGNYPQDNSSDLIITTNSKNIAIIKADLENPIYKKKLLPTDQKVSPAIFFVKEDKPIEREIYLQQLPNTPSKNQK